ncbi:MAG: class I SAM-dependent methyltransferase [Candidatus Levybacteria bacterium]|nr:class I SAM-dependent methyltransferase [Candidatus Levybacteria bacterium]
MKKKKKYSLAEKYFRRYLKIAPLSVALCRSVEAKNFATVKMVNPILDIGCGFGEFAQVFFEDPVDMGVDNAPLDLYAASKVNKYKNLLLADARKLPLADQSYSTIISVSTMEHIKKVDSVFKEAYRVLKSNGVFVITVETNKVDKHTFYRPLLKKIGMSFLSEKFTDAFNVLFHRHTILSKKEWEKKIKTAGFFIEESRYIVSPAIIKFFDIFIPTALPSQLFRPIFGKRIVYRPEFIVSVLTRLFLRYIEDEESEGTVVFLVARKA